MLKIYLMMLVVVVALSGCNSDDGSDSGSEDPYENNDLVDLEPGEDEVEIEDGEDQVPLSRDDNSSAQLTTLNAGIFDVGDDIPAGRYTITGDAQGNLFVYTEDGIPIVNEILGGGDIGVDQVTTDIREGNTIEISGINAVTFTPAETIMYTDSLTTGTWIAGLDIPIGRYDLTSDRTGNLLVYDDSGWPLVNEILGESDYGVEKVTVHLEEGFIIEIVGMNVVNFEER